MKTKGEIARSAVRVETASFEFSHGRKPSGGTDYTPWMFEIGNEAVTLCGKYSEAKRQAVAYAAERGIDYVVVCS
jgi:hypothetical protein